MINDLLTFKTSKLVRRIAIAMAALAAYVVVAKSMSVDFEIAATLDIAGRAAIAVVAVYVCAFLADRRVHNFQKKTSDMFRSAGLPVDK